MNSEMLSALFALPDPNGQYPPELTAYFQNISHTKPVILFSFPPKCGGTFLRIAATLAVSGQIYRVCYGLGGGETQFYLPTFLKYYHSDDETKIMVMHGHTQARKGVRQFLKTLDLKPVTMLRSISDMLVSQRDMLLYEENMLDECVSCDVPEDFSQWTEQEQSDFLINIASPWYLSYYESWIKYALSDPERVLVLHFDDFHNNPADVLQEVLSHSRINCPMSNCVGAVQVVWNNRKQARFNKGVAGRGREYFSEKQMQRLEDMMSQYKILDSYHGELL